MEATLFFAATHGLHEELKEVIRDISDFDIDVQESSGRTPLMMAVLGNHVSCVGTLLLAGATPDIRSNSRDTALMLAAGNGNIRILRYLIASGASLAAVNNKHQTALSLAAYNGHLSIVKLLHTCGANLFIRDKYENTILHYAAMEGFMEIATYALEEGITTEVINLFNEIPLTLAIIHQHLGIVKYFVHSMGSNDHVDKFGNNSLHTALLHITNAISQEIALVCISLENLDALNDANQSAIMIACELDNYELATALLERGVNIMHQDLKQKSCLSYALENKNIDLAQDLIHYNENIVMFCDTNGYDGFLKSCLEGHIVVTQLIYDLVKPDLQNTDNDGNTALHLAVLFKRPQTTKYLLSLTVYPRMLNNLGQTVLDLATISWRNPNYDIIRALRQFFLRERIQQQLTNQPKQDLCGICHEDTSEYVTLCGHVFHVTCMLQFIMYLQKDAPCPICRHKILE